MFSREHMIDDAIDYIKTIGNYELVSCLYTLEQQDISFDQVKKEIILEIQSRLSHPQTHEVMKKILNDAWRENMKYHLCSKLKQYYREMLALLKDSSIEIAEAVKAITGEYIPMEENRSPIYLKIQYGELLTQDDMISLQKLFPSKLIQKLLPHMITANANVRTINVLKDKKNDSAYTIQTTFEKAFTSLYSKHEHNIKTDVEIIRKYPTPTSKKVIEILDLATSIVSCMVVIGIGVAIARMHDSYLRKGHLRFWEKESNINKVEKILGETKPIFSFINNSR